MIIDFGGGGANLQEKTAVISLSVTEQVINPDSGYDGMSKVTVSHAPVEASTTTAITSNGTITITPSEGYDATTQVVANVNVPQDIDFTRCGYDTAESTNATEIVNGWIDYTLAKKNEWDIASTSALNLYQEDNHLIYMPQLSMENVTTCQSMCRYAYSLKYVPSLHLPVCTDISGAFYGDNYVEYVGALDTPALTTVDAAFYGCHNLKKIASLNFSSVVSENAIPNNWNYQCSNVTYLRFVGNINVSIRFNNMTALDYDSIKSILTAMSNSTTTTAKQGIFNHTITDREGEIANLTFSCLLKGWTFSGLTIQ